MTKIIISDGVAHKISLDLQKILISNSKILAVWEDITPLARNEWICWVTSAKKKDTVEHRLNRMKEELLKGKRRPCCWAGCTHR